MPQPVAAVVFDAYGTLLDVHAAAARHSARLGAIAAAFSADRRAKQLEYSWTLSMTGPGDRKVDLPRFRGRFRGWDLGSVLQRHPPLVVDG